MPRKTRRRVNGEGTIRKRTVKRSDGTTYKRWYARVTTGVDPATGKQERIEGPWRTSEDQANQDRRQIIEQLEAGQADALTMTLSEYLDWWLEQHEQTLTPSSRAGYEGDIRKHLKPHLGKVLLADLGPMHVQRWQTKLIKAKSPHVARKARACLSAALTQAVRWQLIPHSPLAAVAPVKRPHKEYTVWDPEQVQSFLEVTETHQHYAMFLAFLSLGVRLGELRALKWTDINGDSIHVRHGIVGDSNLEHPSFGPPKYGSVRWLPVDEELQAALVAHRKRQEGTRRPGGVDHDLIFAAPNGAALSRTGINGPLRELTKRAKLPELRIHDLRHTAATLWIRAGMDVGTVSVRLGHKDKSFTLRQYAHHFEAQMRRERVSLRSILKRASAPLGEVKADT